jgi:diguanylate cyclase (GGDEF)-like protein
MLDAKPEIEGDVKELRKIAALMQIDEIHLFDENGVIYSGSEPKYYGYSFDSGSQMAYFKPMLEDKELTMCQDVTPNTAEGKSMMYAITWNEAGDKLIQIGIEPVRLLEELRRNEIPEVVANIPAYDELDIFIADAASGEIYGSTNESYVGSTLEEMGVQTAGVDMSTTSSDVLRMDGDRYYSKYRQTGDYIVLVTYSKRSSIKNFLVAMGIELVYLLLAGIMIIYTMRRLLIANHEKNTQMAILASMSDIYNSMHMIDLEQNTITEYNAREEISKVVSNTYGADASMKQIADVAVEEEYYDAALEFMDLHTLVDRMKHKKIVSEEFMSKAIGWYRASFITIDADEEGHPTKVIYVTQNIDKIKKKEEELIFKSNTDGLTGLYNRRAYEDDIAEYNDTRMEENFVFVSFDVNGLKTVNDGLGHAAGDELLLGAAYCIRQCFEPYGRIYRIGGDEFVAMIHVNETQLQSIKMSFKAVTAKWSGRLVDRLSVSSGYVTMHEAEDTASIHKMAELADKRMYEEKNAFYEKGK